MKIELTQDMINRGELKCPEHRRKIEYCDGGPSGVPGLLLEVAPGRGSWMLRYKKDGHTKYVALGSSTDVTLSEARKAAKTMRARIVLGADPRAEAKARKAAPTFDQLMIEYFKYVKPRKRSWDRDAEMYRLRIQARFGHLRLNQITRHQIQSFHTSLSDDGLAPATANHHIKLMRYALNLAVDWKMLDVNPAARIPLLAENNEVDNTLNEDELGRLLNVLRTDRNVAVCQIALFLLATGCRLNEALTARWDDIDLVRNQYTVQAEFSKSRRTRVVYLSPAALEVLNAVGTRGEYEHVFVNRARGQRYTTVARSWARIRSKAGLPKLRCHDLRHQYGRMLAEQGESLVMIGKLLGHLTHSAVTLRYAHVSAASQHAAAAGVSAKLTGGTSKPAE